MKDLNEKWYIKVFCGQLSAGYILGNFNGKEGLYSCNPYDIESEEPCSFNTIITLNDFIIGGYVFFTDVEDFFIELDKKKGQLEKLKAKQEVLKEEEV